MVMAYMMLEAMFGNGAAIGIDPIIINSLVIQLQRIRKDLQILMILQSRAWKKECNVVAPSSAQINIAHVIWSAQEARARFVQQLTILVLDV